MGLYKYFWTTTLVYYICISVCFITSQRTEQDRANSRQADKCAKQCGGWERNQISDETDVCCDPDNSDEEMAHYRMSSNCLKECVGAELCSNTLECLCEVCKAKDGPSKRFYKGFCSKRGEFHIFKKDCEALVCTGKVPYRGDHCKYNGSWFAMTE